MLPPAQFADCSLTLIPTRPLLTPCTCCLRVLPASPTQVVGPSQGEAYIKMKLKEQDKCLDMVNSDPKLQGLRKVGGAR